MRTDALTPEQQQIWGQVDFLWRLAVQGDAATIRTYLHPRYSGWDNASPAPHDRDQAVEAATRDTAGITSYELTPMNIEIYDAAVAVVHYRYRARIAGVQAGGRTIDGRWTETYLRQGEKWLLISVAGGPTP